MLDYGHNPAGYRQVIQFCKNLGYSRLVGVIGMPGDRMDTSLQEAARLSANAFDQIYIKEDHDLRGRNKARSPGCFDSITGSGYPAEKVAIIENELDAMKAAISNAKSGDLIVVFYEKLEPLLSFLDSVSAHSIEAQSDTEETVSSAKVINL